MESKRMALLTQAREKKFKISKIRRFVLLAVIILFLLQFLKIKLLVGSMSASLVVWAISLIDVFAYLESLLASKSFTLSTFLAALPVVGIYLIFGRAFCGWVCPMDYLFEFVSKISSKRFSFSLDLPPWIGYFILLIFLIISLFIGIPIFTNYFSHLTNFFRALTGLVFAALSLPFETSVIAYSLLMIIILLVLEFFFPRLWCRVLCPVGKVYGLFNKVSLLSLKFKDGICGECALCEDMCYMKVKILQNVDRKVLRDGNCIYCGRCVDGCEARGKIIEMKIGR